MTGEAGKMQKKRLVSKTEYVGHMGKLVFPGGLSMVCLAVGILSAIMTVFTFVFLLYKGTAFSRTYCIALLLQCGIIYALLRVGWSAKRKVENAETVTPITQHSAEHPLKRGGPLGRR